MDAWGPSCTVGLFHFTFGTDWILIPFRTFIFALGVYYYSVLGSYVCGIFGLYKTFCKEIEFKNYLQGVGDPGT